jgi:hypothetical protein
MTYHNTKSHSDITLPGEAQCLLYRVVYTAVDCRVFLTSISSRFPVYVFDNFCTLMK